MAWLTNWNKRKSKTVNGTTAGAQTNYQMKLTVHKGTGTDTDTDVYLDTNVRDDFGDVRFTSSDGSTLLPYWIESYTPGVSATIWINIDYIPASPGTTTIYIYYDNPTATTTSNGRDTFIFFDDFDNGIEQLTEVDPSNHIVIDRTTDKRLKFISLTFAESAYAYKDLGPGSITDFVLEFDYLSTTPNQYDPNLYVGFSDTLGTPNTVASGLYTIIRNNNDAAINRTSSILEGPIVDTSRGTPAINWANRNVIFYYRFSRVGTTAELSIFSDPDRTLHITGSPISNTVNTTAFRYFYPVSSNPVYNPDNYQSGWIDNIRIRKYANPEPTFGTAGISETTGCPTSPKYSGDTVTLQATPKDGVAPYYVEFRKDNILIDPARLNNQSNPIYNAPENVTITRIYTLDDADIAGATTGTIDFSVYIEDSCPTGHLSCTDTCTITIGCTAPVCNFTVT